MIHPYTKVLNSDNNRGSGVFATHFIPKGTLITVPTEVDQVLSMEQVFAMPLSEREFLAKYAYLTNDGKYILHLDQARYMNHSCDSNTLTVVGIDICIAVRDILPNEEITEDYGLYYADDDTFECLCGSLKCRHKICEDDIQQHGDEWDHKIASVFHLIPTVEQPLWGFISSSLREEIEAILASNISFPSCKVLKCSPDYLQKAGELLWPSTD